MGRNDQRAKAGKFQRNLRALIAHEGWTQPEAAKRLNIPYKTLRKLLNSGIANETEKNRPLLQRICDRFGIGKIDFLWSSNLKPGTQSLLEAEVKSDAVLWQLSYLLADEYRETSTVSKIIDAIDSAYGGLVLGIKEAKKRARGGSFVDRDSEGNLVAKNRRRGQRSKKHDDY